MQKFLGAALLFVCGLAITATPALALQTVVTQVDKNSDGSMTYHFAVKLDLGETLTPGASKATADCVTVYNFYGLVEEPAIQGATAEMSGAAAQTSKQALIGALATPSFLADVK